MNLRVPLAILVAVAAPAGAGPVATPAPQDIPVPVAGDMGLAGDAKPDIARFLNVRDVSMPRLSPDGTRLSYLTSTTGLPQVWVSGVKDREARQLTFAEKGVTFQDWSPAGDWIAYGVDRDGDEQTGFYLVSVDGRRERQLVHPGGGYRYWGAWSPDGRRIAYSSTERNGTDCDIYVLDIAPDGTASGPRRIHDGLPGLYVEGWSPDGATLLLTQARGESERDVFSLDVRKGKREVLFRPKDAARYESFSWLKDGSGFYLVTNQDRDRLGLAFFKLAHRQLRSIETSKAEVREVAVSPDQRWLAWTANDNGYGALHIRNLQSGQDRPLNPPLPRGNYSHRERAIRWAPAAPVLAVMVTGPAVAGDAWVVRVPSGETARVTTSATAGLDPARFVVPDAVSFKSWDGETVYGLLYLPPGAGGKKPPLLMNVHGGPSAQATPVYNPAFQYLLTRGVAVFDLNFRGSLGYGKRFARLDDQRLRPNAVKDMAGALDWLASTGKVDAARAAVMGASYGGYMTFAALTTLPDRFKAGIGLVGVSNWVTALEGASPDLKATDRVEYGDISDPADRQFFRELSPITHVKNVRAPLMVLHGANDPRDPPNEADQLVAAIRLQGGDVEYLRFPDEGHSIRKLANRVTAYRRIASFLQRTLAIAGPEPAAKSPAK